jgi:hypothetical protein
MYQAELIFNDEVAPRKGVKIPFGIHTNIKLKGVEVKKGEYFDITFEDKEGRFNNKRLFQPNGKYPRTTKLADGTEKTETKDESIKREEMENIRHLVKLLHIFLEGDLKSIKADTYDAFVDKAAKALNAKVSTKTLNIKLIYDSEGRYTAFGNFPDYVEEYIDGQAPTLEFSKWELANRCTYKGETAKAAPANDSALNDILG